MCELKNPDNLSVHIIGKEGTTTHALSDLLPMRFGPTDLGLSCCSMDSREPLPLEFTEYFFPVSFAF